jgi:hypothetical protein
VEDQDHPLVGDDPGECPDRLVTIEDGLEGIARLEEARREQARQAPVIALGLDRQERDPAPTAKPVAADIHEDPVEPRLEAGRIAQRARRLPGPDQGILGRILGFLLVAQEHARQPVGPIELTVREAQESFAGPGGAQLTLPSLERWCDPA